MQLRSVHGKLMRKTRDRDELFGDGVSAAPDKYTCRHIPGQPRRHYLPPIAIHDWHGGRVTATLKMFYNWDPI